MEADPYQSGASALQSLGDKGTVITPGAGVLAKKYRYILCGGTGGSVTVRDANDVELVLHVNAGDILGFRPTKITAAVATPLIGVD